MSKILIDEATVKLALEALEAADWYINQLEITLYSAYDAGTHEDRLKVQQAITVLRLEIDALNMASKAALAEQPAQQCWKCGDMDAAFQAKCNVPACGMKEKKREFVGLTDEMVTAAARALNKRQAEACGVDKNDHWQLYGDDIKEDARAALEAAHGIKEKT